MEMAGDAAQSLRRVERGVTGMQDVARRMVDVHDDRVYPTAGNLRVEVRRPGHGEEVAVDQPLRRSDVSWSASGSRSRSCQSITSASASTTVSERTPGSSST